MHFSCLLCCICQGHSGGKGALLELYTRCLCQFIAEVAQHSVCLLEQRFADVLNVIKEKLLSNVMSA